MPEAPVEITMTINGVPRTIRTPPDRRLLDLLRDDLGLTGTKEGCGCGECGACTVLVDGALVNACLLLAAQADGASITTVEGLGTPESPSVVQAAFVAETASQCGYSTPGMVVAVTKLLEDHPEASRDEARRHLSGNLCRCTGYRQILNAVERARSGHVTFPAGADGVGRSAWRVDALDKVTGRTRYAADLPWPEGLLHGVTVRSTEVHARLVEVRTGRALAMPGVVRVLTSKDIPGETHFGNATPDQPVLVVDHIRFYGEAIAVVLAESLEAARDGAAAVEVVTEPLPPVTSPEAALADGAPLLHPDGNLAVHHRLSRGDARAAMARADVVVERTYRTPAQEHVCLEPEVAVAYPDGAGGVTVKAPSQNVFFDRHHIARALGLSKNRVRMIQTPTGAAFGGREDVYAHTHAALGAVLTGRPTRIVWTREESQVATTKRHPAVMQYKAGLSSNGKILAMEIRVLADTGAYQSWAPNIGRKMLVHATGPYDVENVSTDIRMAYTNNGISGAFRGFGATQVLFAAECFADELATAAGLSPVAFRRLNHLAIGRTTATGQKITGSCGLAECMDRAVAEAERMASLRPPPPPGTVRGRGLSTIYYGIGYGNAIPDIGSAIVELLPEGMFQVRCGAVEYGQGLLTVFTQIAAEVLGVGRGHIRVMTGDSAETPDSGSTVASRQTYVSGEAVRRAAERLRTELLEFAAQHWQRRLDRLTFTSDGLAAGGDILCSLEAFHRICVEKGVRTRRQARFKASSTRLDLETGQGNAYWPYAFAAHVAGVEVDTRTGNVRVISIVAAHDVGKAINPAMVEGQIAGGAAQGLGFALFENHRFDNGVPLTRNLDTYRIPGFTDMPDVVPILVEEPEPTGPFGAKGVGEPVLVALPPAIANAVAAATGKRFRELPILPEDVRRALCGRPGNAGSATEEG